MSHKKYPHRKMRVFCQLLGRFHTVSAGAASEQLRVYVRLFSLAMPIKQTGQKAKSLAVEFWAWEITVQACSPLRSGLLAFAFASFDLGQKPWI
jgi:hypothetical protein